VRQVLNNLLTNAFEALEGQAAAAVSVETHHVSIDGHALVELVVSDNGPGFQSVTGGQMFDPYVTSKPKGTGLGLAIVKKIIDEHGGFIEADNMSGGGARVRALLPKDEAARAVFSMTGSRDVRRNEFRREHV
jgi:nitrogen fixation/metabolism regulation signal transduction histidine kinase